MQRALIAGVAIAITTSVIGLFLVLRRNSLFGDALSHVAFGGIAVGLVANVYPLWTGIAFSVLGALGITKLRRSAKIPADATVAVLLASGLALGLLLFSLSGQLFNIYSYLFGSILVVSMEDTLAILAMAGAILAIVILLYRQLLYVTFDEEQAKVSGLPISKLNYLFVVLASVAVIVSMRLVGILLVSALIVIPNITALLLGKGFKKTALISVGISIFSVVTGIAVSYAANLPPAATIVIVSIVMLLATLAAKYSSKRQMEEKLEVARS
ncbi:MAG: zinc ABC transporter permease [Thaumarchaeota archaeon 13_1_40CM_3_50_5]|nr:MAG: zinc ABC transporter permease [Thaumarchaeota archaeon 13_1_40CM_4_48_7]OLC25535.1 MAG: zinc ABC transporter permease [Candidatus Nitrososphaera sp. 13_1_40CM_48_12]OLC84889.1 MAG: zinc ABC transporter permease [Thaumarchaeota archaeon 13_1_40CM_3_50_5]